MRSVSCSLCALIASCLLLGAGCSDGDEAEAPTSGHAPPVDAGEPAVGNLVVDTNRNGKLEPEARDEQAFEASWDETHGAVLMANVDDDDQDGLGDHLDDVVNGTRDALDLARIRVTGSKVVPAGAVGRLSVDDASAPFVRIFRVEGDRFVLQEPSRVELSAEDLANGVELAIEARFFSMSPEADAWSGRVDVEHGVYAKGVEIARDRVRMRVAPLVLMHNLMKTERIWVGHFDEPFVAGVKTAAASAGVPVHVFDYERPGYIDDEHDPWTQDHFEVGYASMPSADGLHTMLVAMRTPRVKRTSADVVFLELLGPDFGAIHVHAEPYDDATRSLDSMGNFETVPPYEAGGVHYPHGRFIVGSTAERHPDRAAEAFLVAQRVQPILRVDTSWLSVGHVDEILSFVPADTARGWQMLFARPATAVAMLEQLRSEGHGDAVMHEGKWWWSGPADRSVNDLLADPDLMATNQEAQVILDGILAQLEEELGLSPDEITYMPFLQHALSDGLVAYQPASVNLLHFDGQVLIADPHGPRIDGEDVFKQDLDARLGALGLATHYVDDWDTYHRNNGDTHCATNTLRVVPADDAWWEGGR